jgi:hypothetical protein
MTEIAAIPNGRSPPSRSIVLRRHNNHFAKGDGVGLGETVGDADGLGDGLAYGDGIGDESGDGMGDGEGLWRGVACGVPRFVARSFLSNECPITTDQDATATKTNSLRAQGIH